MLTNMRNTGNHLHNVDVLRKKKGTLIVCHRPSEEDSRNLEDYTPCSECLGYFKRTLLYKDDCPVSFELPRKKGTKQVNKGELLLPASGVEGKSTSFTTFIQSFRRDAVSLVGRTDRLILKLAETGMTMSNIMVFGNRVMYSFCTTDVMVFGIKVNIRPLNV